MFDHSWTFNASDCAEGRAALELSSGNESAAQTEHLTAVLLHEMASRSWAQPRPSSEEDDRKQVEWELRREQWYQRHLGFGFSDQRFSQWWYKFFSPTHP